MVLSPDYLSSLYAQPEWAAAFAKDPTGAKGILVPVRVRPCKLEGMLSPIIYTDLVDLEQEAAREALLKGIERGRLKPVSPPAFPVPGIRAVVNPPQFPGALPPIWRVAHNRNPNFTGREEELSKLREQLKSGEPAALTQTISGLGGVGKTQMALEYTYRHTGDYSLVWWVRAEEPAALASDFADLAAPLGLPQASQPEQQLKVEAVRRRLGEISGWLLVFDNAGGPEDLRPYIPQGGGGHLIITSRNDVWQRVARKLPLKTFSRGESVKFLVKRTGIQDEPGAVRLAEELGDLPLALEQTGAYIEASGRDFRGYLDLFRAQRRELLALQPAPADYPDTVATTWELSMKRVGEESPEGLSLLNLWAFFSPDDIPLSLPTEGNEHLPEAIARTFAEPLRMDKAITSLKRYSLIELSGDGISVHRLVQAIVRDHISGGQQKSLCAAAVEMIDAGFPSDTGNPVNWPACSRLTPHALTVCAHAESLQGAYQSFAKLFNNLGEFFIHIAQFQNAKKVLEKSLEIRRKLLGEEHPDTAISLNNMGYLLLTLTLGDSAGARPYYEQALAIRRKVLGEEHPGTATSLNNMGYLLLTLGDSAGARPYYEQALAISRKVLGERHPNTALSLSNLGNLLQEMGDSNGARLYYEQALTIRRQVLGKQHPDTAKTLINLSTLLLAMGDLPGARHCCEQAIEINRKVFGERHPYTAQSLNNFGKILLGMGDLPGARHCCEQALAINRELLGEQHPHTILVSKNLETLNARKSESHF